MSQQAEYVLEQLFAKAFDEPDYRVQFINTLLDANIYVAGNSEHFSGEGIQEHITGPDETIQIKSWPHEEYGQIIPFFTSLDKMRIALGDDAHFVRFSCRVFFEMTLGSLLILNPESEVQKPFYPDEIEQLLQGDQVSSEAYTVEEDTQVLLGQPEKTPYVMFEQLSKVLTSYSAVQAAYFAQMYSPAKDQEASYIIGLLFNNLLDDDQIEKLHQHIGQVAYDALEDKKPINLLHIDHHEKEGINAYFLNEVEPFYSKPDEKKKGFFAKLFS